MKRREFLKGLSVAGAVAAVPALADDKIVSPSIPDTDKGEIRRSTDRGETFTAIPDYNPFTVGKIESFLKESGIQEFRIKENQYYVSFSIIMPVKYRNKVQVIKDWMYHNKPAPIGCEIICDDLDFYSDD